MSTEPEKKLYRCSSCGAEEMAKQSPRGWVVIDKERICTECKAPVDVRYYQFGAVLETRNPDSNCQEIARQVDAVHTSYNDHVAIEKSRRDRCNEYIQSVSAPFRKLTGEIDAVTEQIEVIVRAIKERRIIERRTNTATEEEEEQIKKLSKQRSKLYAKQRGVARKLYKHPRHKPTFDRFQAEAAKESLASLEAANITWDTKALLLNRTKSHMKGAPPKFKHEFYSAAIRVQIQKGMTPAELFRRGLKSGRAKLEDTGERYRKVKNKKIRLWIRVGSDEKKRPIWASMIFVQHREFPEGCLIKEIQAHCRQVGTRRQWHALFSVESPPRQPRHRGGRVAIDIGWRRLPNGTLRVLYWVGDDGREGEVVLPAELLTRIPKSESIHSHRDRLLNRMKFRLNDWLKKQQNLPEWLQKRAKNLPHWRSCARLRKLTEIWAAQPVPGGERMLRFLQSWRRRDIHLYTYEVFNLKKFHNIRMNIYRHAAKQLAGEYETIVMEDVDWKKMSRKPPIDSRKKDELARAREAKRYTAPSLVEAAFKAAFVSQVLVSCVNISWIHSECSQPCGERNRGRLNYRCEYDGVVFDQDRNACFNMLRVASGEALESD